MVLLEQQLAPAQLSGVALSGRSRDLPGAPVVVKIGQHEDTVLLAKELHVPAEAYTQGMLAALALVLAS